METVSVRKVSSSDQMDIEPFIKQIGTHKCPEREKI